MTPVALIWLAFLHAFSLATASAAVRGGNASGRLGAHIETNAAGWISTTADVPVPDVRVPERVPLRAAQVDAQRAASPIPHGKGGSALPLDRRLHALPVRFLRQLRLHGAFETHRLASRGALLPYFPTAPPRRA